MPIIALQLYPVVCPDFIVELLHEKTFSDLGSWFDGLLAQLVERTTLNR